MAKNLLVSFLILICLGGTAEAQIDAFRYQPGKNQTAVVYHYLKTNIDGTNPEHVSIYVAAQNRIESFKFHPQGGRAGLVIATMDWSLFSAKKLESWQIFKDKPKVLAASLDYLSEGREVRVALPFVSRYREKVAIPFLPFHVYNFDFASLNFAFPHLIDPAKPFTIGVSDPTFSEEGPAFRYRGEVEVTYIDDEMRGGTLCRKYRVDGPGLENQGGTIWVNKTGGYFQDVEIKLPDNPNWQTFKFKLEKVERMSRAQWEEFMKAQF